LPFLTVGGHIFRDSEFSATENERWIAYITFISGIILTISKSWVISINRNPVDIWFLTVDIWKIRFGFPIQYIVYPQI
jgi:hypothetical protein